MMLTRDGIAWRIARDLHEGDYVNLGVGIPVLVSNYLDRTQEIFLHSENGILGVGPRPKRDEIDLDLISAGKGFCTLSTGAAIFDQPISFAMMRGGHIDLCVLGAFQVAANGDLANWHTGEPDAIPAVGGAMDLAIGAKQVFVMMEHLTKSGESKIVERCTLPLTGVACVDRVYSDLAIIDVTAQGFRAIEMVPGMSRGRLKKLTGAKLSFADTCS